MNKIFEGVNPQLYCVCEVDKDFNPVRIISKHAILQLARNAELRYVAEALLLDPLRAVSKYSIFKSGVDIDTVPSSEVSVNATNPITAPTSGVLEE